MIDTSLDAIATTGHCASSIAKEDGSLTTVIHEDAKDVFLADSSWQNTDASIQKHLTQLRQQGVQRVKWVSPSNLTISASSVCDTCLTNEGQIRMLGEPFETGVMIPPQHPNCLCTVEAVTIAQKDDGSLDTPAVEHLMGKHDQKTHGNKYGTDDKGNKVLVYKGGSGGKAGTKKIYKSIASFKDAMSGKTPDEKEAFLLANGGNAWIKSLTAGQRSALSTYTGHSYHQINESIGEALRKNTPLDKVKQSIVDRATQALLNNKIPESITVTRGVHGISHLFEVGKAFTDKGFMSTSVGSGFSGFKLTIQLPKGSPGGYISPLSQYGHEKEFLLPPGARFQVVSKDASGAVLHYIGQS